MSEVCSVGGMNFAGMKSWSSQPVQKCDAKFEASSMLENGLVGTTGWSQGYGNGQQRPVRQGLGNQEEVVLFMQKKRWAMHCT